MQKEYDMKNFTKTVNKSFLIKKFAQQPSNNVNDNNKIHDPMLQELHNKKKHFLYMTSGGAVSTIISVLSLQYLNQELPVYGITFEEAEKLSLAMTSTKLSIALNTFSIKLGCDYFKYRSDVLLQQIVKEEEKESASQRV